MAINWGGGLSGAFSGASMGAGLGLPGMIGGGLLGGALGAFGGQSGGMQQVNPYAAPYWDLMNSNLQSYQNQIGAAEGRQDAFIGGAQRGYDQLANFQPTAQYDPQAAIRAFNAQAPQLQQLARASAVNFGDAQGTAADRAQSVGNKIAQQYQQGGALNSGAAAQAIGEGSTRAAGDINLQMDQGIQSFLNNLYQQNLAAQMQNYQTQLANAQRGDQMRFSGIGAQAAGYGNIAGQYGQRAANYGNLVGSTQAGLGQMAGQEYAYTPPSNPMLDALQMGAGVVSQMRAAGDFQGLGGGGGQSVQQPVGPQPYAGPTFMQRLFNRPSADGNPYTSQYNTYNPYYGL